MIMSRTYRTWYQDYGLFTNGILQNSYGTYAPSIVQSSKFETTNLGNSIPLVLNTAPQADSILLVF